jgi:hypothetical protein
MRPDARLLTLSLMCYSSSPRVARLRLGGAPGVTRGGAGLASRFAESSSLSTSTLGVRSIW